MDKLSTEILTSKSSFPYFVFVIKSGRGKEAKPVYSTLTQPNLKPDGWIGKICLGHSIVKPAEKKK
jgi:hypothetical protein